MARGRALRRRGQNHCPTVDIEDDKWWNLDHADEEVKDWRAGDGEEVVGEEVVGEEGDVGEEGNAATDVDASAAAGVHASTDVTANVAAEDDDDHPWSMDDVQLFRRRVKHHVDKGTKPRLTATEKGKGQLVEGYSKGVSKAKDKVSKSKAKAMANVKAKVSKGDEGEGKADMCSDEDYAEAAGPIPSDSEKQNPKVPRKANPDARPPSPHSRGIKRTRRGWTVKEKVKWALRYGALESLKKTALEASASMATIRRWVGQKEGGVYKGAASSRKRMHGARRHSHYPDMKEALYRYICINRTTGVPISMNDMQHWSIMAQARDNGWMDEAAVSVWLGREILHFLNLEKGKAAKRALLVLDSYRGHITPGMLAAYRTHSIVPAIVPAGCTSLIQPLDVSINRAFKTGVRAQYCWWFISTASTCAPQKVICPSWEIIINAFKTCGISSSLDGKENHLVMAHQRARSKTDVSEDMSLQGTTGDNSGFVGRDGTVEVTEEDLMADFEEDVVPPAAVGGLQHPYLDNAHYRGGAATAADKLVEPEETAAHAWTVAGAAQDGPASHARVTEAECVTVSARHEVATYVKVPVCC
ncbi:unnamed protein product [Closterium sp. NIES-53]